MRGAEVLDSTKVLYASGMANKLQVFLIYIYAWPVGQADINP